MYWHIDTDIVSLIAVIAIYLYSRNLSTADADSLRHMRFLRCLQVAIAVTVIDIAASIIMEVPVGRFLYHLLMTLYFVTVELVIVEWILYAITILYADSEKGRKTVSHCVITVYAAYALIAGSNPWTGLFYTLGVNQEYQRGPLFSLMMLLYAAYAIALVVLTLVRWKRIPKGYPAGVLLLTPAIVGAAIAVQLTNAGWLMILPGYMLCLLMAFLFLQTVQTRSSHELVENLARAAETDPLTGLYNRMGMEAMVQKTLAQAYGQRCLVLIVDLDDLKCINDTLGHAQGDRAIQAVAAQLKRHFRSSDTIVRYGGDEFLAFMTGELNEAQMHRSLQQLVAELSALRIGEQDETPIRGSVGAVCGVVGDDTFEALCNRADTALYHVKRNGKNGYAFYKPEMDLEVRFREKNAGMPSSVS